MSLYLAIPFSLLTVFVGVFLANLAVFRSDAGGALCSTFALFGGLVLMLPLLAAAGCLVALFFLVAP